MITKKIAVYPGSFDPLTLGHLDLVQRATKVFDEIIILVAQNPQKVPLFSISERVEVIKKHFQKQTNITVDSFNGLLVSYMKKNGYRTCLRGLRVLSDFEYEFQMAITNKQLYPLFDVFFLLCDIKYANISSTLVKEIIRYRGDVKKYVPECVFELIQKKESSHEF